MCFVQMPHWWVLLECVGYMNGHYDRGHLSPHRFILFGFSTLSIMIVGLLLLGLEDFGESGLPICWML
jgi:hypothetical protein